MNLPRSLFAAALFVALPAHAAPRNIVVFVADGLRYESVNPTDAPTMWQVKTKGVDFTNSHAVYPTVTTANASAIATGHYLGDTGDYGNVLSLGFPVHCGAGDAVTVKFLEDDCVLRAMKARLGNGYMGQTTLLQAAHGAGYDTVLVGKKGPAAIQWIGALDSKDDDVNGPLGVFVDDATNHPKNFDGTPTMSTTLGSDIATDTFAATGAAAPPYTTTPNLTQQAYLAAMTSQVLIPDLHNAGKPFVLLFWSRDPDATQHSAIDSSGRIVPGINSVDARQAIYNADSDLRSILEALKLAGLADNTDVFVTADHGFSTIAKGIPAPDGSMDVTTLGAGFLAIDVAKWLGGLNLYDPGQSDEIVDLRTGQRPGGDAIIGPSLDNPKAVVAANGGSDFIYVPNSADGAAAAKLIFKNLVAQPYVGALFVNDELLKSNPAAFAGALPMSAVNLIGSATVPRPAIVVSFRSFVAKGCKLSALMCTAEIADTPLQTGQGMHGTLSRADTRNFMAAIGPDFKAHFADKAPVSNADIAPTLAHIIHVDLGGGGNLKGRVDSEALNGGAPAVAKSGKLVSQPAANGDRSILQYQEVGTTRYFDAAGFPGRSVGLSAH